VRLPAPCGTSRCLPAPALRLAAGARILPSEGGHAEFPFLDGEEENFAAWLRRETGRRRLIGDMVVSGSGLGHLFAFSSGRRLPDAQASGAALDRPDILDSFARFYARACRDFVLETLALRGLFITGGLALRLPVLNRPAFLAEFRDSAAHSRLLEQVPIRQVLEPSAGIWGAALLGALREEPGAVRE
ncbi:MAG: glucokinase, partial [Desulfovibrio sp.]|nr:glucokinase [Desulfovibrio sp.]